jgi:FtsH-binding integral membrane protein
MQTIDAYQRGGAIGTDTATLLSRVLWITTVGFLFTALGAYYAPDTLGGIGFFGVFIVNLILIFAIQAVSRRSPGLALALFYGFTVLMGVEIGPLIKMYLHMPNGQQIVFQAAGTTALGMAAMAIIAEFSRFNYVKVGRIAFFALGGLILIGIIGMFVHWVHPGVYAWLSLVIFSVLLLVDFMRLKDGGRGATPVTLALSIYLDAINIFIALLQIFGGGSRSRD